MATTYGQPAARTAYRYWLLGWLGAPVIGVANGVLRRALLGGRLPELRAHQVSTASLVALLGGFVYALDRRAPIGTAADAVRIGALWASLTVQFEFAFGHYVAGQPWALLLRDYDLAKGRVWGLVPLSIAVTPSLVRLARLSHQRAAPVLPGRDRDPRTPVTD